MLFPDSAKNAISSVFYDKTFSKCNSTETIDSEGGIVRTISESSSYNGNVRFNNLGELQAELGLVKEIDVAITCPTDTAVEVNDVLQYNGVKYIATTVIPYDSHKLIVGSKWEKQ